MPFRTQMLIAAAAAVDAVAAVAAAVVVAAGGVVVAAAVVVDVADVTLVVVRIREGDRQDFVQYLSVNMLVCTLKANWWRPRLAGAGGHAGARVIRKYTDTGRFLSVRRRFLEYFCRFVLILFGSSQLRAVLRNYFMT